MILNLEIAVHFRSRTSAASFCHPEADLTGAAQDDKRGRANAQWIARIEYDTHPRCGLAHFRGAGEADGPLARDVLPV
jgi:hypothetical protein